MTQCGVDTTSGEASPGTTEVGQLDAPQPKPKEVTTHRMRYVIMADGNGTRWQSRGLPKHLVPAGDVALLVRTVRLLHQHGVDADDIIITSHDPRYAIDGATLYAPVNNHREIDRFTAELICDNMCFLYGDTYYSQAAMRVIVESTTDGVVFLGTRNSIVAIKIASSAQFLQGLVLVEQAIANGQLHDGKGWHVYRAMHGIAWDAPEIGPDFIFIEDLTRDINTWDDYQGLLSAIGDVG